MVPKHPHGFKVRDRRCPRSAIRERRCESRAKANTFDSELGVDLGVLAELPLRALRAECVQPAYAVRIDAPGVLGVLTRGLAPRVLPCGCNPTPRWVRLVRPEMSSLSKEGVV